jgi:phage shock protein C
MASYCSACGSALAADARFCSSCGREVAGGPTIPNPIPLRSTLVRPRAGRKIAGVCQGLANQYGWDATWTRVIAAVLIFFTFPIGLLAYILFWLVMPEEPLLVPKTTTMETAS